MADETIITIATPYDTVTITGTGVNVGPTYDKLVDWERSSADDLDKRKRPMRTGDYTPTRTTSAGRLFSIEGGKVFAESVAAAAAWRERLVGLYADGAMVTVTVDGPLGVTSRKAFVETVAAPWSARPDFTFTIDFYAPDPRRYGAPVPVTTGLAAPGSGLQLPANEATGVGLLLPSDEANGLGLDFGTIGFDGRVTLVNTGWAATDFVLDVSGGTVGEGFEVVEVETGRRIVYVGAIVDGTTYTIDGSLETAFVNGTSPAGRFVTSSDWWSVPPRSSSTLQFLARGTVLAGAPTLTATIRPASL